MELMDLFNGLLLLVCALFPPDVTFFGVDLRGVW
jgi:hypothetical protein